MGVNKKEVGNRIKSIRLKRGLSMREFGLLVDIDNPASDSIVSRWERGVSLPSNDRLPKISELGNVTVDELLYGSFQFTFNEILTYVQYYSEAENIEYSESKAKFVAAIYGIPASHSGKPFDKQEVINEYRNLLGNYSDGQMRRIKIITHTVLKQLNDNDKKDDITDFEKDLRDLIYNNKELSDGDKALFNKGLDEGLISDYDSQLYRALNNRKDDSKVNDDIDDILDML